MGRGNSKISGANSGGRYAAKEVVVQSGDTVDLSDSPLVYGGNDTILTQAQRDRVKIQEDKRLSAKSEYAIIVDENGLVRGGEYHGGKGSVKMPASLFNNENAVFTHNHPRGAGQEGILGGTFSDADLDNFASLKIKSSRASAAEGTYSISKTNKFNSAGFKSYVGQMDAKAARKMNAKQKALGNDYDAGKITYSDYSKAFNKAFNEYLIDRHNGLLAGQKAYGYSYTLERRG